MAQSAHIRNYCIEQLNGGNYYNWKFRMEAILAENGVSEVIKTESDVNNMQENEKTAFVKNDNKAKSLIIQCVEDSQLESLRDKNTAYKMWTTLEEKYEKKGMPGQLFLKKKLLSMKLKEGEQLEKFIMEFEEVLRQLKAAGTKMEDQDIICNLLLSLPKSYETIVTVIENMSPDTLKYEDVKKKLFAEMEKRNINKGSVEHYKGTAFMSEKVCYKCGKPGHFKRDCRYEYKNNFNQVQRKMNARPTTDSPGSSGREFYREKNKRRGNGSQRGNHNQGRSNYIQNEDNTQRGRNLYHNQVRSNYVQNSDSAQGNVESDDYLDNVCFMGEVNGQGINRQNNVCFFIDSGCTDHMVNDRSCFSDLVMLDCPIKIAVAKNDNYLLAEGVGNIQVHSYVEDEIINCTIKNVFYVPNLRKNLLSVKKLEMSNIKVVFENGCVKLFREQSLIGLGYRNNLYEI